MADWFRVVGWFTILTWELLNGLRDYRCLGTSEHFNYALAGVIQESGKDFLSPKGQGLYLWLSGLSGITVSLDTTTAR